MMIHPVACRLHINLFPPSTSPLGVNGQFKFVSSRNFTRETPLFFFTPVFSTGNGRQLGGSNTCMKMLLEFPARF